MSGKVRLTEGERDALWDAVQYAYSGPERALYAAVEAILVARLAPVEKVLDQAFYIPSQYAEDALIYADHLRVALAPQPAPGENGGAS